MGQRYYHELHFFCSECGDPFLDPSKSSAPGTEKGKQGGGSDGQEEDGETNEFVIHKGHPYCERCHLRLHKPKCKACTLPIPDVAISAMGAKWHKECFVCSVRVHCVFFFFSSSFPFPPPFSLSVDSFFSNAKLNALLHSVAITILPTISFSPEMGRPSVQSVTNKL